MIVILIFTLTAFLLSIIIVLTDNYFQKDNIDEEIINKLPGYNCGACGYGSCEGMKEAILKNKNNYHKCKFIKDENVKRYFDNL